jgi:hypothetical protein
MCTTAMRWVRAASPAAPSPTAHDQRPRRVRPAQRERGGHHEGGQRDADDRALVAEAGRQGDGRGDREDQRAERQQPALVAGGVGDASGVGRGVGVPDRTGGLQRRQRGAQPVHDQDQPDQCQGDRGGDLRSAPDRLGEHADDRAGEGDDRGGDHQRPVRGDDIGHPGRGADYREDEDAAGDVAGGEVAQQAGRGRGDDRGEHQDAAGAPRVGDGPGLQQRNRRVEQGTGARDAEQRERELTQPVRGRWAFRGGQCHRSGGGRSGRARAREDPGRQPAPAPTGQALDDQVGLFRRGLRPVGVLGVVGGARRHRVLALTVGGDRPAHRPLGHQPPGADHGGEQEQVEQGDDGQRHAPAGRAVDQRLSEQQRHRLYGDDRGVSGRGEPGRPGVNESDHRGDREADAQVERDGHVLAADQRAAVQREQRHRQQDHADAGDRLGGRAQPPAGDAGRHHQRDRGGDGEDGGTGQRVVDGHPGEDHGGHADQQRTQREQDVLHRLLGRLRRVMVLLAAGEAGSRARRGPGVLGRRRVVEKLGHAVGGDSGRAGVRRAGRGPAGPTAGGTRGVRAPGGAGTGPRVGTARTSGRVGGGGGTWTGAGRAWAGAGRRRRHLASAGLGGRRRGWRLVDLVGAGRWRRRELVRSAATPALGLGRSLRLLLLVGVGEDVALELRRLDLGSDGGSFLGRRQVLDLQLGDRGLDAGQLIVVAVGLVSLRHGTS